LELAAASLIDRSASGKPGAALWSNPMPEHPDRVSTWDENKLADALIGGGGGIAVWVKRGEAARASVRNARDLEVVVMELAHIQIGVGTLVVNIAEAYGLDTEKLADLVTECAERLAPHVDHAGRITPAVEPE
jgi:hypothetical protein